jgi:ribosomal protein S18 acetylase RimI-like enzyme
VMNPASSRAQEQKASFGVRRALHDDYEAFANLFPELQVDDPIPAYTVWVSQMVPFSWVAIDGEAVLGYCCCQEYEDTGYLRQIVVAPWARHRGVGGALMRTAAKHLRVEGKRFWRLNVKPDNHSARRLYESMGLTVAYQAVSLRFPWASLGRIPAGKASIGHVGPERDREIESAFGLPAGQLASARGLNRIMLDASVVGHDDVVGLAVFDPNFPGAFPFRVRDLGALEPLMTAIRVRARPGDVFLGIVVEDDARLADLLVRAGAEIRDEILHMAGGLPTTEGQV